MSEMKEIELKLRLADERDYPRLVNDPIFSGLFKTERVRIIQYATTYYDTRDRLLYHNGYSYRIRKAADICTATVKDQGSQGGGLFVRGEWNVKLDSAAPSIGPFLSLPVGCQLESIVKDQELLPLFRTDFQRTAIDLRTETGSLIEVAADLGSIVADQATAPICEVELELKEGEPVDLLRVGAALADVYSLRVGDKSKYARGLDLLGLPFHQATSRPEIDVNASVGSFIRAQGIFYLQEILAWQEKYLGQPEDPESIHQIRVKTRHLRSLLSFFKPVLEGSGYGDVTGILRGFAGDLGYLRELDVLAMGWQEIIRSYPDLLGKAEQLSGRLAAERDKEQAAVYQQLAAGVTTPGLLRVWAWLLEGFWDDNGEAGQPLRLYMEQRLLKWLKRLDKRLKSTAYTERQSIHALRIQGKKLRYVLQSLEPVLKKRYRRLLPNLKTMQEQLGLICDAHRNVAIIKNLNSGRKNNALQYESGIYIGFMLSRAASLTLAWEEVWPAKAQYQLSMFRNDCS